MGGEFARQHPVEQVGALAFQSSKRRVGAVSGRSNTVYTAIGLVHSFWSSWRAAVLAIGVEDLAHQDDCLRLPPALEGALPLLWRPFFLRPVSGRHNMAMGVNPTDSICLSRASASAKVSFR
jgi:hypothetical protein